MAATTSSSTSTAVPVLGAKNPNAKANVKPVVIPQRLQDTTKMSSPTLDNPRKMLPIIISIEAAIGTGKSSLLKLLQRTIGKDGSWLVVQEPVEQWQKVGGQHNLLDAYYRDQSRYAFSFQTNCILSRIKGLQDVLKTAPEHVEVVVLERCWASDRNTFGEMLRRSKKISELEWALYEEWYTFAVENAPFIDGHVYLEATSDTCMARLRRRDRSEEVGVTAEYQRDLIECHETWLSSLEAQERVCRVPVDGEFISDEENAERVVSSIANFIEELRAMRSPVQSAEC